MFTLFVYNVQRRAFLTQSSSITPNIALQVDRGVLLHDHLQHHDVAQHQRDVDAANRLLQTSPQLYTGHYLLSDSSQVK